MAITDHTRKVLWSLSGNACARCQASLVRVPEVGDDPHAIVGQECHIIARAPSGPRGNGGQREDLDGPENLILLCAICHALVDAQPQRYPPEELRRIKARHVQRIAGRTTDPWPELRFERSGEPVELRLMDSGDALLGVIASFDAWSHDIPSQLSPAERGVIGDFLQACEDSGEAYDVIGPRRQLESGQDLDDLLGCLRGEGLFVYAGTRVGALAAGDRRCRWAEGFIRVVREKDVRVPRPTPAEATA